MTRADPRSSNTIAAPTSSQVAAADGPVTGKVGTPVDVTATVVGGGVIDGVGEETGELGPSDWVGDQVGVAVSVGVGEQVSVGAGAGVGYGCSVSMIGITTNGGVGELPFHRLIRDWNRIGCTIGHGVAMGVSNRAG